MAVVYPVRETCLSSTQSARPKPMQSNEALPGLHRSVWLEATVATAYPSLAPRTTVDVAIIGGGIVGLTAAALLKAEGKTVAVLEAARIVEGVTGHTTAKLTAQHGLIYDYLLNHFGESKARAYAQANQAAIGEVARLANLYGIDAEYELTENYLYTTNPDDADEIHAEVRAEQQLGLPASLVRETPLPFPVHAAVRLDGQAQFHPRKYLLGLAAQIPGDRSHVFEGTRVVGWDEGDTCAVETEQGILFARDVIVASHFPVNE